MSERYTPAWKVVYADTPQKGSLQSRLWSIWEWSQEGVTEYCPLEWAEAPPALAQKGYHLLTFATLEAALDFAGNISRDSFVQVWACALRGVVADPPPPLFNAVEVVTGRAPVLCPHHVIRHWPDDTVMAEGVMLLEQVFPGPKGVIAL